jgi:putative PIN family toxin of toxin-antitoxin system
MRAEAVVIDTNVLISAAFSTVSPPARVVRHCLSHHRLLFSAATFEELQTRLWRPKFDRYLGLEERRQLLHDFHAVGFRIEIPPAVAARRFSRDADDDKFLHLALAGEARLLVSGDRDLLDLGTTDSVEILSPAQIWMRWSGAAATR